MQSFTMPTAYTPIRIRGKRKATAAEKWRAGRGRTVWLSKSGPSISGVVRSAISPALLPTLPVSSRSQRRRQRQLRLSKLEELPTEILQTIFAFSENLNLPLASFGLKKQLESRHIYMTFTSRVLAPLMSNRPPKPFELAAARRVLNSRYMTWSLWKAWLDEHSMSLSSRAEPASALYYKEAVGQLLHHLPVPPPKLLRGPWTDEKVKFLNTLVLNCDSVAENSTDRNLALEGLGHAVAEGSLEAVQALLGLGLRPDTELLRRAVLDSGCDREIVTALMTTSGPDLDLLDEAIWSWADKARRMGNVDGDWLKKQLIDAQNNNFVPANEVPNEIF